MNCVNAKHTPGPWKVSIMGDGVFPDRATVLDSQGHLVAKAGGFGAGGELANAHLIAAAPDLLEACYEAMEFLDRGTPDLNTQNVLSSLGAAIAKAKGAK